MCETEKCENCENYPAAEPHTCPYAEEINIDKTTLCNCCKNCESNCAQDL